MIEVMLQIKRPGKNSFDGLGRRQLVALPRIGEHIDLTEEHPGERDSFMYKVVGFHHAGKPTSGTTAGDIYAVWVGSKTQLIKELLNQSV